MEVKVLKGQLEVWEWKAKANAQVKDLLLDRAFEFLIKQVKPVADELANKRKLWKKH